MRESASRYLLTPAADADLDEIWLYVASSGGAVRANGLEDELHAAMVRLGEMPGVGHSRTDLADEPSSERPRSSRGTRVHR